MNPSEIIKGMKHKNRELQTLNDQLMDLSETKAQKEREFKVLRAKKIMELKANKESVTLIPKLAEGDEEVAKAEFDFKVAESMFNIIREKIKDVRTAIDTYRSILTWQREELKNANID